MPQSRGKWPWGRKKVGLALSGGAARGTAHIGVLEVLEREGIRPDVVAGVSAGSVVGALYCAGYSVEQLKALARDLSWSRLVRLGRPHLGLFDTSRMEAYLEELLAGRTFDQLSIPFLTVAVDLLTAQEVVLKEGRVARAVRASCAVPGLFTPVEWNDHLLVDGGLLNNVPVQVLRDWGADYVIAVNLLPPYARNARPRNLWELWMLTLYTLERNAHAEAQQADCTIYPDVIEFSLADLEHAEEMMERGRRAAEAKLEQLRAGLRTSPLDELRRKLGGLRRR
jgi:NTE family protein